MLPGVELARRRRLYHGNSHETFPAVSPPGPWMRPRFERTAMDESAIVARNRLEEKLHRFSHRSISAAPSVDRAAYVHTSNGGATGGGGGGIPATGAARAVLTRKDSMGDVCAVCLDELRARGPVTNLPCTHKYHSDCLRPWLTAHPNCPCCRTLVS